MPGREERKVVTILFTDLVGSTAMAEGRDPEDVRAILTPYYTRLREQIEQRGGTVEKFIGDAVMAVFGAPVAHEDDPIRAVLAALAIRDSVGEELQLRTAVNTGEALVALDANPALGESFVSGDVVNTAARLQSAAPVDGILVGEATWRATRHVVDYRDAEPIEAKGKAQPVPVWEVVAAHSRLGTDVEQVHATELVGRERELFLLEDALARCRREQTAQLVTLVGVPGIGKSRIVAELLTRLDEAPELYWWRQGRSLPYGESRSVWALGEIVKAQAGILESDDAETAHAKLEAMLGELIPDEEERRWLAANTHALAGVAGTADESSDRRVEAFSAWRRLLEALAEQRPLVLVFEDLHWADETLLDFVDYLAEWVAGVPMLIVATARPELLDRRADWGGGKRNATTLSISPLSEDETARLLANVLDRAVLDAETQQAVLRRAEGNPLYAAEYARMLADHEGGELALPETVQGLIAARIDALPPAEKTLLQDASVLGKVFWPGALDDATDELLHALERREFVRRDRRSAVAGETQYAFLHLLVRDVAYGQIPRARRMERHRATAGWIESLSPDRSEDRAEMLAHHYREALALAAATGADAEPFRRAACDALVDASERAAALSSWTAAGELVSEALGLMEDGDARRPELELRLARAKAWGSAATIDRELVTRARDAFLARGDTEAAADATALLSWMSWWQGEGEAAHRHVEYALELVASVPATVAKARAYGQAARLEAIGGDPEEAIRLAEEARALAEELGNIELTGRALNSRGIAKGNLGDPTAVDDLRQSVELADRSNVPLEIVQTRNNYASILISIGQAKEGATVLGDAVAKALQFGSPIHAEWPRMQGLLNWVFQSKWDEALEEADELAASASTSSQVQNFMGYVRASIFTVRGDVEAALPLLDEGIAIAEATQERQAIAPSLAMKALLLHLSGGDPDPLIDRLLTTPRYADPRYAAWQLPFVLAERGRGSAWLDAVASAPEHNRWKQAGRLVVRSEHAAAAELYADIGAGFLEAWAWLLAAEAGDGAALERARSFFAAERARPFLRRCQALLPASA